MKYQSQCHMQESNSNKDEIHIAQFICLPTLKPWLLINCWLITLLVCCQLSCLNLQSINVTCLWWKTHVFKHQSNKLIWDEEGEVYSLGWLIEMIGIACNSVGLVGFACFFILLGPHIFTLLSNICVHTYRVKQEARVMFRFVES